MREIIVVLIMVVMMLSGKVLANDAAIDGNGNLTTGTSNSYGNLKVTGASAEHGVVGETSGTGAAGVYGKNTDNNNYGEVLTIH